VARYPHDSSAFTQGLAFVSEGPLKGALLMSQGQYGESALSVRSLESARPSHKSALPASRFAEGVTALGERALLLTWRAGEASLYQLPRTLRAPSSPSVEPPPALTTLSLLRYRGEGWGVAYHPTQGLVYSDGSATLRWLNSTTLLAQDPPEEGSPLEVVRELVVRERGRPLYQLNELEWVGTLLIANVWRQKRIVVINPSSGEVLASVNLEGLLSSEERPATFNPSSDVLNGVAWRPREGFNPAKSLDLAHLTREGGQLLVTGKRWPLLYELELDQLDP
jgi:glutaminyl-peptide cyclotransferase